MARLLERSARLLAPLLLVGPLQAVQTVGQVTVGEVEVQAVYAWPQHLTEGWFPVAITLNNLAERPQLVQLEARSQYPQQVSVRAQIELQPGASGALELLCPAHRWGASAYRITVRVGSEADGLPPLGPTLHPQEPARAHLVLPAEGTSSALVEHWRSQLPEVRGFLHGLTALPGAASLARHAAAYSSVASVSLDLSAGLPAGEPFEALLTWTRSGGDLALYGADAERLARARPALGAWMEDRFRLKEAEDGPQVWRMGHGRLLVGTAPPFVDPAFRSRLLETETAWPTGEPIDLGALPVRSLTVLLILFALLIGPVNFILVKRSGRPTLLLLTVPAIALAGSVGLVLYAVLAQGLSLRSAAATWTVLDQRSATSSTRELRSLYAGSSAGPGLRPGPGTTVLPPEIRPRERFEQDEFQIEQGQGQLLGGDYLRVRVPLEHRLLSERPSRARIELRREGDELVVDNGLGVRATELWASPAPGELWILREGLAAGAQERMRRADELEQGRLRRMEYGPWRGRGSLPPGTWMAWVESSPFSDDCGLRMSEVRGQHLVYGILDDAGEAR